MRALWRGCEAFEYCGSEAAILARLRIRKPAEIASRGAMMEGPPVAGTGKLRLRPSKIQSVN